MMVPAPSKPRKTIESRGGAGDVSVTHLRENIIQVKAALASLAESIEWPITSKMPTKR